MSDQSTVTMELRDGYEFAIAFDDAAGTSLVADEAPPLGAGHGPSPTGLLAAAIGNCLAASALFCLRKAHVDVRGMTAMVRTETARNEAGRLRIGRVRVDLAPVVAAEHLPRIGRCLELFEDFCVVTASVRGGVDVQVEVNPVAAGGPAGEGAPAPAGA